MLWKKLRLIFGLLVLTGSALAVNGVVIDGLGMPISRVKVDLIVDGSTVNTGSTSSDGSFSLLAASSVSANSTRDAIRVALEGGALQFTLPQGVQGSMRTMNLAGGLMYCMHERYLSAGTHSYNPFGDVQARPGVYLVQYSFGNQKGVLKLAVSNAAGHAQNRTGSHPSILRLAAVGESDSVRFSKQGYGTTSVPIVTDEDDLGTVTLRISQIISFDAPASKVYGDSPFGLVATSTSALAVNFQSTTSGTCSVTGLTLSILGAGICTVQATQAGNSEYNIAPTVEQSFTVTPKNLMVTGATAVDQVYTGSTATTIINASLAGILHSDNVALAVGVAAFADANAGIAKDVTVTGSSLSGAKAGNYTLTEISGLTAAITPATLVFSNGNPGMKLRADAVTFPYSFTVGPVLTIGTTVTYASTTPTVCSYATGSITLISPGICTIEATLSDASNYAGSTATQSFYVDMFMDGRDNQYYKIVKIGAQTWMAQNLNYGTRINGIGANNDQNDNNTVEKYCFGDVAANCDTDGGLYQWAEAMALPSVCNGSVCASSINAIHQGICPENWHIPKNTEWEQLQTELGGVDAGSKMKLNATSAVNWDASTNNDGNSSGFSAYPTGFRYNTGTYATRLSQARFWGAYEADYSSGLRSALTDVDAQLALVAVNKAMGFSVRCIQDTTVSPTFSVAAGTYTAAQTVTISSPSAGASFFYTTDGTDPTTASAVYTSPITVSGSQTLKAIAVKTGLASSLVSSAAYEIQLVDNRSGSQSYKTVQIGTQVWMAENLSYATASGSTCNATGNHCLTYGRLYNWDAAKMACPTGWHLPDTTEWKTLAIQVGGMAQAGKVLKTTAGWTLVNGTDAFGFSALPGGYTFSTSVLDIGYDAFFWTATAYGSNAYFILLDQSDLMKRNTTITSDRYSVRCLLD